MPSRKFMQNIDNLNKIEEQEYITATYYNAPAPTLINGNQLLRKNTGDATYTRSKPQI